MTNLALEHMVLLHTLASQAVSLAVTRFTQAAGTSSRALLWQQLSTIAGDIPLALQEPMGAFVTLKLAGNLRGCIGYILPHKPLYQTVMECGVSAALHDKRFAPVVNEELANLELEVNVLTVPQLIASYQAFRVGQDGIILEKAGRTAVFLPDVAVEQGWNREQTLEHLAHKAGLPTDAWRHGAKLQVFSTQKYEAPLASTTT